LKAQSAGAQTAGLRKAGTASLVAASGFYKEGFSLWGKTPGLSIHQGLGSFYFIYIGVTVEWGDYSSSWLFYSQGEATR